MGGVVVWVTKLGNMEKARHDASTKANVAPRRRPLSAVPGLESPGYGQASLRDGIAGVASRVESGDGEMRLGEGQVQAIKISPS